MIWHILTIICGVLVATPAVHSTLWSNILMGVLVVIFASLALRSYRRRAYN